ncbi:MAG: hypothetical protein HRU09_14855 [Oligoflexales bacterium]|nr:hypothetical protein [Oligoflexales bacterium]
MRNLLSIFLVVNFVLVSTSFSTCLVSNLSEEEIETVSFLEQHRMQVLRKLLPGLLADLKFKKAHASECEKYLQKYLIESDLNLLDDLQIDSRLLNIVDPVFRTI